MHISGKLPGGWPILAATITTEAAPGFAILEVAAFLSKDQPCWEGGWPSRRVLSELPRNRMPHLWQFHGWAAKPMGSVDFANVKPRFSRGRLAILSPFLQRTGLPDSQAAEAAPPIALFDEWGGTRGWPILSPLLRKGGIRPSL